MYTNNSMDIRFPKDKSARLLRGCIINRSTIANSEVIDGKMVIKNVNFPIAYRIIGAMSIDVLKNDEWLLVKSGDYDTLRKVYDNEKKVVEEREPEPIEINTTIIPESVVEEKPIIDLQVGQFSIEPKLLEERMNISESITTTVSTSFEPITIDSVNSSSTMEIDTTTKSEASEEVIVEEESEEDDEDEYEEVEEIVSSEGMNHSNPPRIVKKKKKHK